MSIANLWRYGFAGMDGVLAATIIASLAMLPWSLIASAADNVSDADYFFETKVPRFALLIGNRYYVDPSVHEVFTAHNDVRIMAGKFASFDFDTIVLEDAALSTITTTIAELYRRHIHPLRDQHVRPIVMVYYSGHGFTSDAQDFVAGSDVSAIDPIHNSLSVNWIIEKLSFDATLIILLDACRTYAPVRSTGNATSIPSSAIAPEVGYTTQPDKGIPGTSTITSPQLMTSPHQGVHNFFAGYAAFSPGQSVAVSVKPWDIDSLYTDELYKHLGKHGLEFQKEHDRVKREVHERQAEQEPTNAGHSYVLLLNPTDPEYQASLVTKWKIAFATGDAQEIAGYLNDNPDSKNSSAALKWLDDRGISP